MVRKNVTMDSKSLRSTRQRQVILDELRKLTSHPTAADLYEIVRQRLPKISLGTIYRNLELLTQMEVIQKLQISGAEARFDGNPTRHCHIRCVRCNRVGDLHEAPYDPIKSYPGEMNGHEILGCRIEFFGICPACRKSQDGKVAEELERGGHLKSSRNGPSGATIIKKGP